MSAFERFAHGIVWAFFIALPLLTVAATFGGLGVDDPEHPDGVSLRDERASGGGFFFVSYRRSHAGGGLFGGK